MLNNRILELRKKNNLTQKEFAERTGIAYSTYQSYEYGTQTPRFEYLQKLSTIFNVPVSFFTNDTLSLVGEKSVVSQNESVVSRRKNVVSRVVSVVNPPKPHFINIPVYDEVFASAGNWRFNEECVSFYYSVERSLLKSCFKLSNCENLAFLRACGDSMTPTLPPNARLLAQTRTDFKEGQIVLARLDDDLFVKRLHKQPHLKLVSDNEKYEPIILQGKDYELIAVIVGFLMSFEN